MRHLAASVALACSLAASSLHAQGSPLALTVGGGGGWAGTTCRGCVATNENGPAGLVQLAAYVAPALRLGVEWNGWSKSQFGARGRMNYVMAVAELYPADDARFYLKGSAGYGHMLFHERDLFGGATVDAEQRGFAYGIGAGYDIPATAHVTVAPYLQLINTAPGNGRVAQFDVEHQTAGMLQYGVSLRLR
jgi:hypothetical protein